jgi:cyanophycin synthetase
VRPNLTSTEIPESFRAWRQRVVRQGALPVIGVAGSRGKSTVIRLLDAIFSAAGLRVATWTDAGVEIRGRRQKSELAAWESCLRRLAGNTLDVVIQELDWPTVNAVGLPASAYPVVAVTNICVNNDRCMIQPETRLAIKAYERVRSASRVDGALVLNGDDFAVAGTEVEYDAPATLFALSHDAPLVRVHLAEGGRAGWVENKQLIVGTATASTVVSDQEELLFALGGLAGFQVQNALAAVLIAEICGMPPHVSGPVIQGFVIPNSLPGSFNQVVYDHGIAIVDRPTPSWYLRPILRAMRQRPQGGTIVVCGQLQEVPDDDLTEVGRMVARGADAIVLHSEAIAPDRIKLLRAGIDLAERAMVVVHTKSERTAISRGLAMMRPGDGLLVLSDNPTTGLRQLSRATGPSIDFEDA